MMAKQEYTMFGGVKLVGGITLWVALFWGTPDIADGIIHYLQNANSCQETKGKE